MQFTHYQDLIDDVWSGALTLLDLGGPVVAILMVVSVIGFALVLYKIIQFVGLRQGRIKNLHKAVTEWQQGDRKRSRQLLERSSSSLAKDVQFGLENLDKGDLDALREELARRGVAYLQPFGRYLRPLELIYYLAPLLGLLGTVLGMIDAFRGLEVDGGGGGDSTVLAGGIWEALLTTAVGLAIAIPFAVAHALFETRLDAASHQVMDLLTRVLTARLGERGEHSTAD